MEKQKKEEKLVEENNRGIEAVKNQLVESYQSGVVEDQLENNKAVNHFNNQSK